ncbi:MAG: alpha-ketoglutarate-dependent dioxygenase AlkB [Bacteriovorax sp.]|nr:alpha-ketoglutarate-dependent dioxygenase AlkB [Bacteriovorax sp.]
MNKNLLPEKGIAIFYEEFFSEEESKYYFLNLEKEIEWKQEPIVIFGKKVMQPRLTAWYGDNSDEYRYSGITMKAHEWTPVLLEIKKKIEAVAGVKFTGALLNFYRDEKDSMGWHKDDEKELGKNPVIGSVSFGASRTFKFQNIKNKEGQVTVDLTSGSFLLMSGETQHHWKHSIPKRTKPLGARINITFRIIKSFSKR